LWKKNSSAVQSGVNFYLKKCIFCTEKRKKIQHKKALNYGPIGSFKKLVLITTSLLIKIKNQANLLCNELEQNLALSTLSLAENLQKNILFETKSQ